MDYDNIKQVKFYIDCLYSKYDLKLKKLKDDLIDSNNNIKKKIVEDLNNEIKYNSNKLVNTTISNILTIKNKKKFTGGFKKNKNINISGDISSLNFIEQNILNNINNNSNKFVGGSNTDIYKDISKDFLNDTHNNDYFNYLKKKDYIKENSNTLPKLFLILFAIVAIIIFIYYYFDCSK